MEQISIVPEPDPAMPEPVVLIVTSNSVEALDIADAFQLRRALDHVHVRSAECALDWLQVAAPSCLVFGAGLSAAAAADCVALASRRAIPTLLVVDTTAETQAHVVLQRPFTVETLDAALDAMGL